jgi:hypothetical protein
MPVHGIFTNRSRNGKFQFNVVATSVFLIELRIHRRFRRAQDKARLDTILACAGGKTFKLV